MLHAASVQYVQVLFSKMLRGLNIDARLMVFATFISCGN